LFLEITDQTAYIDLFMDSKFAELMVRHLKHFLAATLVAPLQILCMNCQWHAKSDNLVILCLSFVAEIFFQGQPLGQLVSCVDCFLVDHFLAQL